MKPRTKIEVAVHDAAKYLTKLNQKQIDFAYDQFFPKLCYQSVHKAFCLECGENVPTENIRRKRVTCESCGSKLQVERTMKRNLMTSSREFALADTFYYYGYEFQIIRLFQISARYSRSEKKYVYCQEITQHWISDKNKVVNSQIHSYYSGSYSGGLEIRRVKGYNQYRMYPSFYLNESKFLPKYTRVGINAKNLGNLEFDTIVNELKYSTQAETLLKAGYYNVIKNFSFSEIETYWSALKICMRNKYKIKDGSMYKDTLKFLDYCGKDLLNSYYVCPKNLKKTHDEYMKLKQLKEAQIKLKIAEEEKLSFFERIEKFANLKFEQKEILIEPLKSIKEFQEEAEEMKHCLFTNEYYNKNKQLILSAKVNGKRMETIAVSLESFQVLQCRGFDNEPSKYHSKIKRLINSNLRVIQKIQLSN